MTDRPIAKLLRAGATCAGRIALGEAGADVAGAIFDAIVPGLAEDRRSQIEAWIAESEATLEKIAGPGPDRDAVIATAQDVICKFGPPLTSAPEFQMDAEAMAAAAFKRTPTSVLNPADPVLGRTRQLVKAFYERAVAEPKLMAEFDFHISKHMLGMLKAHSAALEALPAGSHQFALAEAARALLGLPMRFQDFRSAAPSTLLRADSEIVPVFGRDAECKALLDWCLNDPAPIGLRLYVGQGGEGKTRLLLHAARKLLAAPDAEAWRAGFLKIDDMQSARPEAVRYLFEQGNVLIVVDYAETMRAEIGRLIRAATDAAPQGRIRIVLLARAAGDWWQALLEEPGNVRGVISGTARVPIQVEPVRAVDADEATLVENFAREFAARRGVPAPGPPHLAASDRPRSMLELQAAALLAALGSDVPARIELLEDLVAEECRYWRSLLGTARNTSARDRQVKLGRQIMAVATLLGGIADADITGSLGRIVERPKGASAEECEEIIEVLTDLYGAPSNASGDTPRVINPLEPDRVGEALVDAALHRTPALVERLMDVVIETAVGGETNRAERALTVLTRMAKHDQKAARWLERAFADPERAIALAPSGIAVAKETGDPVGSILARALRAAWRSTPPQLPRVIELQSLIEPRSIALIEMRLLLAEATASATKLSATQDHNEGQLRYADACFHLSTAAFECSEFSLATEYAKIAATHYAAINEVDTVYSSGYVGKCIMIEANAQNALGFYENALQLSKRSTDILEKASTEKPSLFIVDYIMSVGHMSIFLAKCGHFRAALTASKLIVDTLDRSGAGDDPAAKRMFAGSLNNLAVLCAGKDLSRQGAHLCIRALRALEGLDQDERRNALPQIAVALLTFANRLRDIGKRRCALDAIYGSTQILEKLSEFRPDQFRSDYAAALNNLSNSYADNGYIEEAIDSAKRAIAEKETLVSYNKKAFLHELINACLNICSKLHSFNRSQEAWQMILKSKTLIMDDFYLTSEHKKFMTARLYFEESYILHSSDLKSSLERLSFCLTELLSLGKISRPEYKDFTNTALRTYQLACKAASTVPDEALLASIEAAYGSFRANPVQPPV